jgi:ABC-type lipoprotein export system ATPase subunit
VSAQLLRGTALRYEVEGQVVLDQVEVAAAAGRMLAVCGPSGAGKSSLLGVLGGLLSPSAGSVELDGAPVHAGRNRITLVLQSYGLVSALTARENVAIPLQARGINRTEVRERTNAALADLGLAEVADHLIEEMSGGQQQRVAVARALAAAPEVLLADEPTAELDADNRERVITLLTRVAAAGAIVVIASHDPDIVARCADVLELDAGRVVTAQESTGT